MRSIAIDFDGTLCEDRFPEIGSPRQGVINFVKYLQKAGWRTVLWTCRKDDAHGDHLKRAVEWCKEQGLSFDAINENLPEVQERWGGDTRKVMVDFYLDDKSMGSLEFLNLLETVCG